LRIGDCGLWIERGRQGWRPANLGVESCKTNPISPGRGRLTEEIVQNEAKLGEPGVYGQRQPSCGAWLGRGVKCAKRTQFGGPRPHDCGLRIQRGRAGTPNPRSGRGQAVRRGEMCKTNPIWRVGRADGGHSPPYDGGNRAKQSQFGPGRWRAKCLLAKSLGTIRRKTGEEKQSQFVVLGQMAENGDPPPGGRPQPPCRRRY
jgi:hypothetical protein